MMNRRKFFSSGIVVAGLPLLGNSTAKAEKRSSKDRNQDFYSGEAISPRAFETFFISHRGVHLNQRIAGENTIESLRLAKRVGFQCVEFDVRFTKDQRAVVIHDETINRTLTDLAGKQIDSPLLVRELTFDQLRSHYLVRSENPKARVAVPSLEEYLHYCNLYKVIPFVEIKEHGLSQERYAQLIHNFDTIIGAGNYVVTSNNQVSDEIRALGYADVMVMGILYQTTFARIESWKHAIMAISATRHSPEEFQKQVRLSNSKGIMTESHADTLDKYNLLIEHGIDFVSTDVLYPEYGGVGQIVDLLDLDNDDFEGISSSTGIFSSSLLQLAANETWDLKLEQHRRLFLYGVALEMEFSGRCTVSIKGKTTEISNDGKRTFRYPLLLHREGYSVKITAMDACKITGLRFVITKF